MISPSYFLRWNAPLEGNIPWFYLCVRGYVTIGVGLKVDPIGLVEGLELFRPDGKRASPVEMREEWERIKAMPELAKLGAQKARKHTHLRLSDECLLRLVEQRMRANEARLRVHFPAWPDWPHEAQLFAHSMAWALGSEWPVEFPRCAGHLRRQDWRAAAGECTIREIGNPGVRPRNVLNRALLESLTKAVRT